MKAVRWSRPAQDDLAAIDDHYAAVDLHLAARVTRVAVAAGRFLLDFPHAGQSLGMGRARKWRVRGTPYLLFYQIVDDGIEIIRVRHVRQEELPDT